MLVLSDEIKIDSSKLVIAVLPTHRPNITLSEVSCENCAHTAITAKKKKLSKGCYAQRDSGGVWTTPEMSGQGSNHGYWDSKGMYEGENTAVI